MTHVTLAARRMIVGLMTLVGGYYAVVGAGVLFNLAQATRQWTQLSSDPDFPADSAADERWEDRSRASIEHTARG